jgi:hypothetical protein
MDIGGSDKMKTAIIILIFVILWFLSVRSWGIEYCDNVDAGKEFVMFCYVENLDCWDYCSRTKMEEPTCSVGETVNINGTIYECKEK